MEKNTKKRGGAREGAGRPKGDSRMVSFRAPGVLADSLDALGNKTEFIKRTLSEALAVPAEAAGIPEAVRKVPAEAAGLEGAARRAEALAVPAEAAGLEAPSALGEVIPARRVTPMELPFFDVRVVAGFPVPLDNDERAQDIDVLHMLCPHPEASYLIRVNGDSMIDAGIMSGDIVIVDKSNRHPSPREIAVCELNGEYTLKHFVVEGGEAWLVPANQSYPKFRVSEEDDFSVWGTVTYIIHKARG